MVPMNFLTPMKLLFSCNYAVIGDILEKYPDYQLYLYCQGPYIVILLDYLCYQLALIKRIFIVWWHKSFANFLSVCVCV